MACESLANGGDQIDSDTLLENIAKRARAKTGSNEIRIRMYRQENNFRTGARSPQFIDRVYAIENGHGNIG